MVSRYYKIAIGLTLSLVLALTISSIALGNASTVTVPGGADGASTYAANCAYCHGSAGQGTDLNINGVTPPAIAGDNIGTVIWKTRHGSGISTQSPPNTMPAFDSGKISDQSLVNLGSYINGL